MKTTVKCILFVVLAALVLTMVPASLAAEKTEVKLSELTIPSSSPAYGNGLTAQQNLIVQTALAYFYKGEDVQYGSYKLSTGKRNVGQIVRQTNNGTPEEASSQNTYYTVCSAFQHDAYYNALGYHVINPEEYPSWANTSLSQAFDAGKSLGEYTAEELNEVIALGSTTIYFTNYAYELRKQGRTDVVPYLYSNQTEHEKYRDAAAADLPAEQVEEMIQNLQAGDILVAYRHEKDTGHAMMVLGETNYNGKTRQYIIHSAGSKYDEVNTDYTYLKNGEEKVVVRGLDRVEAPLSWQKMKTYYTDINHTVDEPGYNAVMKEGGGSIRIDVAQNLLGKGGSYDFTNSEDYSFFAVIRPLALESVQDMTVTPNGLARTYYPGLEITKTASVDPYNSVRPGDQITFTIELTNRTNQKIYTKNQWMYSGLWVEETIPAGTSCPDAVNGKISFTKQSVISGQTKTLKYTVTVEDAVAFGQTLTFPAGKVGGNNCTNGWFDTPSFSYQVEGIRPEGISEDLQITGTYTGDTAIADAIYGSAGYIGVDLPEVQELIDAVCTTKENTKEQQAKDVTKIVFKDPETLTGNAALWQQMIVPGYVGGTALRTENEAGLKTNENRLLQFNEDFLQVGDILIRANVKENTKNVEETQVHVYLGNSNFAVYKDGEYTIVNAPIVDYVSHGNLYDPADQGKSTVSYRYIYSEVQTTLFLWDFFVCLRPSLAYQELPGINAGEDSQWYSYDEHGVIFNKDKTVLIRAPQTLSGVYRVPSTVKTVVSGAFTQCANLTGLTLPAGVTTVEDKAWVGGEALKYVCFRGEEAAWNAVSVGSGNEMLTKELHCGYIPGDTNDDIDLDETDVVWMLRHVLFPERYPIVCSGDVTGDGLVNDRDPIHLLRHILNPSRFQLKQG